MQTNFDVVFAVWGRLIGRQIEEFDASERAAFFARPQVSELASTPYGVLLDAGISAARRGSLPLELWLACVRASSAVHPSLVPPMLAAHPGGGPRRRT